MAKSPFLESIASYMQVRNYSKRTIAAYLYWIKYFIVFCGKQHPRELGSVDIERFLTFRIIGVRIIGVRVKTPFVTAPGLQILVIFTLTPNIGVTPNIGGAAQRSGASHTNDLLEGIIAQVPPVLYELTEQQFRIHLVVAHQCIVLL